MDIADIFYEHPAIYQADMRILALTSLMVQGCFNGSITEEGIDKLIGMVFDEINGVLNNTIIKEKEKLTFLQEIIQTISERFNLLFKDDVRIALDASLDETHSVFLKLADFLAASVSLMVEVEKKLEKKDA